MIDPILANSITGCWLRTYTECFVEYSNSLFIFKMIRNRMAIQAGSGVYPELTA